MRHSSDMRVGRPDDSIASEARAMRERLQQLLKDLDERILPIQQADAATAERIRGILEARRQRDRLFEAGLFADPAWDILLELYAAELSYLRMSISNLCIGANVPATTALRWIKVLEQKGLIIRRDDPHDGRRVFVSLAPDAKGAMDRLLNSVPPSESLL